MSHIKMHHFVLVLLLGKDSLIYLIYISFCYSSLGLAYAGTNRDDVIELISNALREGNPSMEVRQNDFHSFFLSI
jgi:hypothetical protein